MTIVTRNNKVQNRLRRLILKTSQSEIWSSGNEEELRWTISSIAKNNNKKIHFGHSKAKIISVIYKMGITMKRITYRVARVEMSLTVILTKLNPSINNSRVQRKRKLMKTRKKIKKRGKNSWEKYMLPLQLRRLFRRQSPVLVELRSPKNRTLRKRCPRAQVGISMRYLINRSFWAKQPLHNTLTGYL